MFLILAIALVSNPGLSCKSKMTLEETTYKLSDDLSVQNGTVNFAEVNNSLIMFFKFNADTGIIPSKPCRVRSDRILCEIGPFHDSDGALYAMSISVKSDGMRYSELKGSYAIKIGSVMASYRVKGNCQPADVNISLKQKT